MPLKSIILKLDQVFIYYLLKHKELPLQGIGIFKLEGAVSEPSDPSKPFVIPGDAISFTYNPRTGEDPNLVNFITETTGKIKPLASADLDSYLTLGRQFINIGKPMILPNIGTIEKTNAGDLVFKGGQYVMERITPNKVTTEIEEAEPIESETFSDFPSQKRSGSRGFLYLLLLIILGFIVWAVWKYAFNTPEESTITHTDVTPLTASSPETGQDSAQVAAISSDLSMKPASDTIGFKIVVGIYKTRAAGQNRLNDMKLSNRNVIMYTTDSINYKIAEPFPNLPLSDSTRIKDSMRRFYGDRTYLIER